MPIETPPEGDPRNKSEGDALGGLVFSLWQEKTGARWRPFLFQEQNKTYLKPAIARSFLTRAC